MNPVRVVGDGRIAEQHGFVRDDGAHCIRRHARRHRARRASWCRCCGAHCSARFTQHIVVALDQHRFRRAAHKQPVFDIDQGEASGAALLDAHLALTRFAPHPCADRNLAQEADLPAAQHQARQAEIRQHHADAGRAVVAQLRLPLRRVEHRHMPAMWQGIAFTQTGGVAVEQGGETAHQRQGANIFGDVHRNFVSDRVHVIHSLCSTRTCRPTNSSSCSAAISAGLALVITAR